MKILIVYASQSFFENTRKIADAIRDSYIANGAVVDVIHFDDLSSDLDFHEYKHVDFGMYTWDNGAIPHEAMLMYSQIPTRLSAAISTSVFGSGDTFYPNFCGALDKFRERLAETTSFKNTLRIELSMQSSDMSRIENYVKLNLKAAGL